MPKDFDVTMQIQFLTTLADDMKEAAQRLDSQDTPVHRREFIRSLFVTAEGFTWVLRQDVFAHTDARLTYHEQAALLEETYNVNDKGEVIADDRYLSLMKSLRLAVRIVQRYRPSLEIDFGNQGWNGLVASVKVRNRLVHPKALKDLIVTDDEVRRAVLGLNWLVKTHVSINEAMRDPDYLSMDLVQSIAAGLTKASPKMQKWHKQIHAQLELWQLETAASRKYHDAIGAILPERLQIAASLFQDIVLLFPKLKDLGSEFTDGVKAIQQTLNLDQADKHVTVLSALTAICPAIARDQAKYAQVTKLIDAYLSQWNNQKKKIDAANAEWLKTLEAFEARRAEITEQDQEGSST